MKNRVLEYAAHWGLQTHPSTTRPVENDAANSKPWNEWAEEFIAENPGACVAGAFLIGVTIAWLIKRR